MGFQERISIILGVDAKGATRDLKSFSQSVKEADGFTGKLTAGASAGWSKVSGAVKGMALAAGAAFVAFADDALRVGVAMESLDAKSETVFGDSLGRVQEWAKVNAGAMGATETAAVGAAASIADLLKPMGFTEEAAADQSLALMDLAGALSAWSGGTRTATEVSTIMTKAMLGERDGLKELGISISEAEVQALLLEKGQDKLTGAALAQAKALATQELITRKSTDAQEAWNDGSMDGVKAANEQKASMARLQESLVRAVLPALEMLVPLLEKAAVQGERFVGWVDEIPEPVKRAAGAYGDFAEQFAAGPFGEGHDQGPFDMLHDSVQQFVDDMQEAEEVTLGNVDQQQLFADRLAKSEAATDGLTAATEEEIAAAEAARDIAKELAEALQAQRDAAYEAAGGLWDVEAATLAAKDDYAEYLAKVEEGKAPLSELRQDQIAQAQGLVDIAAKTAEAAGVEADSREGIRLQIGALQDLQAEFPALAGLLDEYILKLKAIPTSVTTSVGVVGYGTTATVGNMGRNARGTDNWRGGPTWVGEEGPEIVNLPRGAQVIPAAESAAMLGGGGGSSVNNYTIHANGITNPDALVAAIKAWERRNGPGWRT